MPLLPLLQTPVGLRSGKTDYRNREEEMRHQPQFPPPELNSQDVEQACAEQCRALRHGEHAPHNYESHNSELHPRAYYNHMKLGPYVKYSKLYNPVAIKINKKMTQQVWSD